MLRETFITLPLIVCLCWIFLFVFNKHKESNLSRYLVWVFTTCFLTLLGYAILLHQATEVFAYYQYVFIFSALSIYPFLFTYVELLIDAGGRRIRLLYKLMPAILFSLSMFLLSFFTNPEEVRAYMLFLSLRQVEGDVFSTAGNIRIILHYVNHAVFYLEAVVYTFLIIKKILLFRKKRYQYNNGRGGKMPVFPNILYFIVLLVLVSVFLTMSCNRIFYDLPDMQLIVSSIVMSLLLLATGVYSIRLFFTVKDLSTDVELMHKVSENTPMMHDNGIVELHRKDLLKERILELFEDEEIYKNTELRINDLSNMLNTNRTYISNTINSHIGSNFSDFVNSYRIEHAKKLIRQRNTETVSLVEIAEESGFSNMNSFYRAFRRSEGISPKQYLMQELAATLSLKRKDRTE